MTDSTAGSAGENSATAAPADDRSEERQRVSAYLRNQGEKSTWLELWPSVIQGRLEFIEALRGVSDAQADFRSEPGDWTIREVAYHMLTGSRAVAETITQLAGGQPVDQVQWTDPAKAPTAAAIADLRREIAADSVAFSSLATRFPDDVSLEPTAAHGMFGDLHCRAWFMFQRVHDQDHARQINAIKDASGYPR